MVFNYKGLVFERHAGEKFDVMSLTFLDYHQEFKEITLSRSAIGRKSFWLAQFSGLTTEYTGSLAEVLEQTYKHYQQNKFVKEEKDV